MRHIPTEIWHYVARFIPKSDIYPNLLGLNQAFFYMGMDIKWRELHIWTKATVQTLRALERLKDPFVARRVHRMDIILLFHEPLSTPSITLLSNISTQYRRRITNKLLGLFGGPSRPDMHPFHKLINGLLECTPHFVNVSTFNFQLVNIEPRMPINHSLHSLLATSWKSFGHNLSSLSLSTKLEDFHNSSLRSSNFSSLTHLEIKLYYGSRAMKKLRQDNTLLVDILAPFIRRLDAHLKHLKLILWAPVDYSAFFSRLAESEFQNLSVLTLHIIDFDKNVQEYSGLRKFLCHSPTRELQTLDLNIRVGNSEDSCASRFLLECAAEKQWLNKVDSVTIHPFKHDGEGMDALCRFVGAVAGSLTHLAFKEYPCSERFAMTIVDSLSSCAAFEFLEIGLEDISLQLVDYMAEKLPSLRELAMYHLMTKHGVNYDRFIADMRQRTYDKWGLEEIAVYRTLTRPTADTAIAFAVVRCTPSITTVFKRPRKKSFKANRAASQSS